jgi:hypothetical protein
MSTLTIRLPATKPQRLKDFARAPVGEKESPGLEYRRKAGKLRRR